MDAINSWGISAKALPTGLIPEDHFQNKATCDERCYGSTASRSATRSTFWEITSGGGSDSAPCLRFNIRGISARVTMGWPFGQTIVITSPIAQFVCRSLLERTITSQHNLTL